MQLAFASGLPKQPWLAQTASGGRVNSVARPNTPMSYNRAPVELSRRSIGPEGPYETSDATPARVSAHRDAGDFLELYEDLQREAAQLLSLSPGQREIRIVTHLVRSHLAGRLVTSSSLAAASGLSYGTAIRTMARMEHEGLITRRARTASGKSASLHPSADLLARWHAFAVRASARVRAAAEADFRPPPPDCPRPERAKQGVILPPPAVLTNRIELPRGLRVLVHADPTFTAMNRLKRQFEMILGAPIRSRAFAIDRLHAEVIENAKLPRSKYDLVAVDYPWFGELAGKNYLAPLDDVVAALGPDVHDFYPDTLASTRWRGSCYGLPAIMTAELLVHRSDVFARAGLAPPRTTDETVAAAKRLNNPRSGFYGIAWNGARGTPLGHTVLMVMAAFGRPVLDLQRVPGGFDCGKLEGEALRPAFLSLEARQTVEYLLELMPYSPPNLLGMAWWDRAMAYQRGKVAMAYSHTLLAPLYETDPASPGYRNTGYSPHPTGPRGAPIVPMGGYALAIPANIAPERKPAALTALRSLTSASATKLYLMDGSLASPRFSVSRDPEVQALSPVIAAVDEMATRGFVKMWPRPPAPFISTIINIAGHEVHDLLSGVKTIGAALRDAQNRADAAARALGAY